MQPPGIVVVAEALDGLRMGHFRQRLGVGVLVVVTQPVMVRHVAFVALGGRNNWLK